MSTGVVTYHDSADIKSITDDELERLGKSENPILRATAFREMHDRSSFNYSDIIMNHLDDTTKIFVDNGEFGFGYVLLSDDILRRASWETLESKNKAIEKVLMNHNYLRSAYTILKQLDPQEKYYPYIKDMATRPRRLDPHEGYELDFDDIEYALYGLAKFKKKEDVQIIKSKLLRYVWQLSDLSFSLMREFPDTAYFDVLRTYHYRQFYKFSGNRPYGFSGVNADRAAPEDFIKALVMQQTEKSAKLLDTMLIYLPKQKCMPDKENIINQVIEEIWDRPCAAYAKLRDKIKPKAEELKKWHFTINVDRVPVDTTQKRFYWLE